MTLINHDKLTTHSFTTTEAYRPLTDSVEKMDPILPFPDIYISQVARQGPSFADVFKETLDSTDPEGLEVGLLLFVSTARVSG